MTFGERLTQLRKEKGYTKRNAFAEVLGIPETTLRNYETDAREPGHKFLVRISNMFDVSVDYLLCLTDEKEKTRTYQLKSSEYGRVKKYRELDEHGKEMVDFTLEKEWERSTADSKEKIEAGNIISITKEPEPDYLAPNAAHERTDQEFTEEERVEDDSMLD